MRYKPRDLCLQCIGYVQLDAAARHAPDLIQPITQQRTCSPARSPLELSVQREMPLSGARRDEATLPSWNGIEQYTHSIEMLVECHFWRPVCRISSSPTRLISAGVGFLVIGGSMRWSSGSVPPSGAAYRDPTQLRGGPTGGRGPDARHYAMAPCTSRRSHAYVVLRQQLALQDPASPARLPDRPR